MWSLRRRIRSGGGWLLMLGFLVPASLPAQTTTAPLDATTGEPLAVTVLAVPMRTSSDTAAPRHVQAVVEVAGDGWLGSSDGTVEIVLHAFAATQREDEAATVVDATTETVPVTVESGDRMGVKLVTALSLVPGDYRLRALAHDPATGRRGVAQLALTIGAEPVLLMPPLIPELADTWVLARPERPDLAAQAPPSPFFVEDQVFVPAIAPRVDASARRLPVVVMGYGLGGHEAAIESELIDATGAVVPGTQMVVSPATTARDGVDRILGVFYMPELAPGTYRLNLGGTDGTRTGQVATTFSVDEGVDGRRLLRIVAPEVPPPVVAAYRPAEAPVDLPAVPVRKLVDGYRTLLATLDPNDRDARIAALAAFEIAAVGDQPEARLPRLKKSQMVVVRELASRDREALVPLLTLHHDVCLSHRRARRAWLGRHGADMLLAVAERYAPDKSSRGAKVVAAQALASLGGHLQSVGHPQGLELFEAALAYHPGHAAALIGLAADPEKRGGPYDKAVRHLERLVEAHPDHREGRLRLALNLLRVDAAAGEDMMAGPRKRALGMLEALVDGDEADWVYALAAQELARELAGGKQLRAAIELLRRAGDRMPEEQKLLIQLAHLLDRSGQPAASQQVLDDLRPDWTGIAPPRGRYNRWPNRALDADRAELAAGAARRQPLLVQAARREAGGVL